MNTYFPAKLQPGDEVRVIAPARSQAIISQESRENAKKRFDELGLTLTFGKHVEECDDFLSSSVSSRIEDLHDAFRDPNVKAILTVIGGFNSNQLLREIDWSIIEANPKIFCGFSDITALSNSIFAKTGLVAYSGVHYSSFGMEKFFDYSFDYFKKCLMSEDVIDVRPSEQWTDDAWYMNQDDRHPEINEGWVTIHSGVAEGTIIGGNLCTLNLLQGTEYMPSLENVVLFLEDDAETNPVNFDRDLVSLIQQPGFSGVKGLVIGRFQKDSKLSTETLKTIIGSKKELAEIPVIAGVDFGHTNQIITFPVGGTVEMVASDSKESSAIRITRH